MQMAVIVNKHNGESDLNRLLKDGWKVIHTCPMPSSCPDYGPTCLVILEKDKESFV